MDSLPLSEQIRDALTHLAVMAVSFPIFFIAADWLRYGG
jgi:hypothetical protein